MIGANFCSITERFIKSAVAMEDVLLHLTLSTPVLLQIDPTGFLLFQYFHHIRPYIRYSLGINLHFYCRCRPKGLLKTIELFRNLIEDGDYSESFLELKEIEFDGTWEQMPAAIDDSYIFDPIEAGNSN